MRLAAAISLCCLALSASALVPGTLRQDYFHKPLKWQTADTLRDTLPEAYAALDAHLRVRVPSHKKLDVSIIYDRRDGVNYRRCRLWRPAGAMDDRLVAAPINLSISETVDGVEHIVSENRIQRGLDPGSDDFTLKLISRRSGSAVIVGQKDEAFRCELPIDGVGGELLWLCDSEAGLLRRSLAADEAEAASFCRFADEAELREYLRTSTDVNESFWLYFDRETDLKRFSVGGDYRLATVKATDGRGYEIVYLGGARTNAGAWRPMQIKGYLRPTGFIGHYNLEWIDPSGRMQKRETSADITDGASLTLFFPLYKSKVRYRKALAEE